MSYSFDIVRDAINQSHGMKVMPKEELQPAVSTSASRETLSPNCDQSPWWLPAFPPNKKLMEKGSHNWMPKEISPEKVRMALSPTCNPMDRDGEKDPSPIPPLRARLPDLEAMPSSFRVEPSIMPERKEPDSLKWMVPA